MWDGDVDILRWGDGILVLDLHGGLGGIVDDDGGRGLVSGGQDAAAVGIDVKVVVVKVSVVVEAVGVVWVSRHCLLSLECKYVEMVLFR